MLAMSQSKTAWTLPGDDGVITISCTLGGTRPRGPPLPPGPSPAPTDQPGPFGGPSEKSPSVGPLELVSSS